MAPRSNRRASGVTFAQLRKMALALPGVEEGTSFGTPVSRSKVLNRDFDRPDYVDWYERAFQIEMAALDAGSV